ncbi:anticodon-binding protein [Pisolithus sp. B1]|nr:anticodon-binding protein [Pisolithus sp. B1]
MAPLVQPSFIKNKLRQRLARAKQEANDPVAKKKRLAENVPKTLDNTREHDPSMLPTSKRPTGSSTVRIEELNADLASDPFAPHFNFTDDPHLPPKVLVTTSPKASRATYDFCDELVGVFPGAEYIRRKKGKGFEVGRIAGWAAGRGYKHMLMVNEDMKKPNAITFVYLPNGPTAYFKLLFPSFCIDVRPTHSSCYQGRPRATPHSPELVLSNFVTSLDHTIGRMFQTLFPPLPEFQGRQAVALHNQRFSDDIPTRSNPVRRYAFRLPEMVTLQEIGPLFTPKLRLVKKGLLETERTTERDENADEGHGDDNMGEGGGEPQPSVKTDPTKDSEYLWHWKPELETSRRTFFL